ncbi:MAG TPA: D-alanyl-D-alanine carboxypeptidase family protein [Solirubrobacteraceae bacterium]|nr:D-alanyl-D-alanine carboxypeptidase family protein [Solirubrobacteraceae bacterium]
MSRARSRLLAAAVVVAASVSSLAWAQEARGGGPPPIAAPQAILVEPDTGDVLFARRPHDRRPVASATKLMTALLVLERTSPGDVFTAATYRPVSSAETRIGLRPGERMKVRDLLRALLLASANDAAQTLAQRTAGSTAAFVDLMNRRARELRLADTQYSNPIGLDDAANYSSAEDLARLTARLRRIPFFARTVALPRARLSSGRGPRVIENRNDLIGSHRYVNGVKTGHTLGAGYVLVGSATRRGVTVVSAVLGEPGGAARDADTLALLNYGLSRLRAVRILSPARPVAQVAVRHRARDRVGLVPTRRFGWVMRRGEQARVEVRAPRLIEGPLPAGTRRGIAIVRVRGRVVARVPLMTAAPIPGVGLLGRAAEALRKPDTLALAAAAAAALALAAAIRRRRAAGAGRAGTA